MKADQPILTIAIPTFNRAKFLLELLNSLYSQVASQSNVELLISDNASPDETPSLIREFLNRGLKIRYLRNELDIGPDANFLQCFNQATGKYIWLIGDDDLILDGGLPAVLDMLEREEPDLIFMAPYVFRNEVAEIQPRKRLVPTKVVSDPLEMVSLINLHADTIFISAAIINRERVDSLPHPPFSSLIGTNVVQLGWIFACLRHFRRGGFVQLGHLAARVGNVPGRLQATKIFGENYKRAVVEMLGADSRLGKKLLGDHLRIWFPRCWLSFRSDECDASPDAVLRKAFCGNPWYWISAFPIICAPMFVARLWSRLFRVIARIQLERRSVSEKRGPLVNGLQLSIPKLDPRLPIAVGEAERACFGNVDTGSSRGSVRPRSTIAKEKKADGQTST
jgi:glycosyltransferase involved in cell wall biosynthesis